jgi:hypothetical protein
MMDRIREGHYKVERFGPYEYEIDGVPRTLKMSVIMYGGLRFGKLTEISIEDRAYYLEFEGIRHVLDSPGNEDMREKLDALCEILTGEKPPGRQA